MRKQPTKWTFTITASHSFFGNDTICDGVEVDGTLSDAKRIATARLYSYLATLGDDWVERPFRGWDRIGKRFYKHFGFNRQGKRKCHSRIRIGPLN